MKKEELLQQILGYRNLPIMLSRCKQNVTYSKLEHYLRYQMFNYQLYSRLPEHKESGKPLISGHQDLPLRDYILGMNERNRLIWEGYDMSEVLKFAIGKKVLDFGYGGGYYTDWFCHLCTEVYGIERPDVYAFVEANIVLPENFHPFPCIENIPSVDVIWVSEVFHGKSENEINAMVGDFRVYFKKGVKLYINELRPDTVLSQYFTQHMQLHTPEGKLYTPADFARLIGWKDISYKEYPFHYIIGGEL